MNQEILNDKQREILPIVGLFKDFGLVGGTAAALYLGHRRSVDFDLFSNKKFDNGDIRKKVSEILKIEDVLPIKRTNTLFR